MSSSPDPGPMHVGDELPPGAVGRFGTTCFWHLPLRGGNPGTNDMGFSPDGRMLAALGYQDSDLSVFEVPSGKLICRWHEGNVDGGGRVLFSPNGEFLAVACDDGLRLRDPRTGRVLRELTGNAASISGIAFSKDGKWIAAAEPFPGAVEIWEGATGTLVRRFESEYVRDLPERHLPYDQIESVAFSPDGQIVAAGSRHFIYHAAHEEEVDEIQQRVFERHHECSVTGSSDGRSFIREPKGGRVLCWDMNTGKRIAVLEGHEWPVSFLGFTRDGSLRTFGCEIWTWDVRTGRRLGTDDRPPLTYTEGTAVFSADGCHAARAGTGFLTLTNLMNGDEVPFKVDPEWRWFNSLVVSDDARWLATEMKGCIHVWDATTGKDVAPADRHTTDVYKVCFNTDGTVLASCGTNEAFLWDAQSGRMLSRFPQQGQANLHPRTLALSPDGDRAVCAGSFWQDGTKRSGLLIFDRESAQIEHWDEPDVTAATWSDDGESLLFGNEAGDFFIRNRRSGVRTRLGGTGSEVGPIAISPDGRYAAVGSHSEILWWDLSQAGRHGSKRLVPYLRARDDLIGCWYHLTFSPDASQVALLLGEGHVYLGPIEEPDVLMPTFKVPREERSVAHYGIGFHPNGHLLVGLGTGTDEDDGYGPSAIWAWDMTTGRELLASPPAAQPTSTLAFSPDGGTLASGSWDSTTLLWRLGSVDGAAENPR